MERSWLARWSVALTVSLALSGGAVPAHAAGERTLTFAAGCQEGERITLAVMGDIIPHKQILRHAFHRKSGFRPMFEPLSALIGAADLAYANLEAPIADGIAAGGRAAPDPGWRLDERVYGYQLPNVSFNFHPSIADDLVATGFDVVSTANNHAMDRGSRGADRTVDHLERVGLAFTGSRRQEESEAERPWHVLTKAGAMTVAWLACTYSTNGIPDPKRQIRLCFSEQEKLLDEIRSLATRSDVDAVILTPHWGAEDSHYPIAQQRALGRAAIEAGAAAVVGAHPHVLQPWEKHVTADGREGLVIHSLGNFLSNQRQQAQRVGAVGILELTRQGDGKARVGAAGYVPTWVVIDGRGIRPTEAPAKSFASSHAARFYPAGNRVGATTIRDLPRNCPAGAATTGVALMASGAGGDVSVSASGAPSTRSGAIEAGRVMSQPVAASTARQVRAMTRVNDGAIAAGRGVAVSHAPRAASARVLRPAKRGARRSAAVTVLRKLPGDRD